MFGLLLLIVTSFGLMGYGYRTMKTGRLPVNPARALKLAMAWAFFSIGMSSMAAFAEAAAAPVAVSTITVTVAVVVAVSAAEVAPAAVKAITPIPAETFVVTQAIRMLHSGV